MRSKEPTTPPTDRQDIEAIRARARRVQQEQTILPPGVREQAADILALAARVETQQAHAEKLKGIIAKRQARVETLEAALQRYGRHDVDCVSQWGSPCDCGYAALSVGDGGTR